MKNETKEIHIPNLKQLIKEYKENDAVFETLDYCIQSLTPPNKDEIVKEYKLLKGYEDKRIEYKDGNFIYYPMDRGIMKNTHITLAGRDRNGYHIQGPITKEFMHKITSFFMAEEK